MEIDSWVAAEGKNGMRRDFLVRDYTTGEVITRATRYGESGLTRSLIQLAGSLKNLKPNFPVKCVQRVKV